MLPSKGDNEVLKFITRLLLVLACLVISGCAPAQKMAEPLADCGPSSVSSPDLSLQGLPELTLTDSSAYPQAIAEGEGLASAASDSRERGKAHLVLVALHLSRLNPNQDFLAASKELDLAVQEDPTLISMPFMQRWLDVFSHLNEMRGGYEMAGQLQAENGALVELLKQKESEVASLAATLEELKKVELYVETKRRLYR